MDEPVTIKFDGAAGTVTGSCVELHLAGKTMVIDCGLFEGTRALAAMNRKPFAFAPATVDAVILTHPRLDHSGRLPLLAGMGWAAPLWCTQPTADLLAPLLHANVDVMNTDAERQNGRADRLDRPRFAPLYEDADIAMCLRNVKVAPLSKWIDLGDGWGFRF